MDSKEKKSSSKDASKRKGVSAMFSCFGGCLSTSDEETSWGRRQMVVPVEKLEYSETETSNGGDVIAINERKQALNYSKKNLKEKSKKMTTSTKPQQTLPTQEPSVDRVGSKSSKTRAEPDSLNKMMDPVRTSTQTNHHGVPEPGPPSAYTHSPLTGLCVLTLALGMMILGGGIFAVICMCVWFCLVYTLRNDVMSVPSARGGGTETKGSEEINVDSQEYKKMVVLRGFLDRDGRKTLADKIRDGGLS